MAFLPLIDELKVNPIAWEMKQSQTYLNYPY